MSSREINDCRKTPWLEFWHISSDQGIARQVFPLKDAPKFGSICFFQILRFYFGSTDIKHKQHIYTIQGIPNTTPFVGPPFFVFLGKNSVGRNEPWYMILLANMVLIAVKPKAG